MSDTRHHRLQSSPGTPRVNGLGRLGAGDIARQWQRAPGFLWLDSADGAGVSYLLADPVLAVEVRDGLATVRRRDGTVEQQGPVFPVLRALLDAVPMPVASDLPVPFAGGIAGVLAYELGHALEDFPRAPRDDVRFPDAWLGVYDETLAVLPDARAYRVSVQTPWSDPARPPLLARAFEALAPGPLLECPLFAHARVPAWEGVRSTHSPETYRRAVAACVAGIHRGDFFQANLTQRLCVEIPPADVAAPLQVYQRLRERCRAGFSAFANVPGTPVLSVSPERFFQVTRQADGTLLAVAEPIKGTRPRDFADPQRDRALAAELEASAKDRAENLMIVDLLRNDISRVARPFSVAVPELVGLRTFATVHHLVSTVQGTLREGLDALDLLAASFPGGSITGAPKVRAMREIARHEPVPRGPYCGSIGWLGFDGQADWSIAIRTVTLRGNHALLGVGGGVVADSDPEDEYVESLVKGHAIVEALTGRALPAPGEASP